MNTKKIYGENLVKQVPGQIVSDMNGEKVMLNISKGKYYNLGETGGEIWSLVENYTSVENIINILTEKYDVTRQDCESEVTEFLELLWREDLVVIKE